MPNWRGREARKAVWRRDWILRIDQGCQLREYNMWFILVTRSQASVSRHPCVSHIEAQVVHHIFSPDGIFFIFFACRPAS